jgi:hypothetical protein
VKRAALGVWAACAGLVGASCGARPDPAAQPAQVEQPPAAVAAPVQPPPQPAAPSAEPAAQAPVLYGAAIDPATPQVALAELMKSPETHAGTPIRTGGVIRRVCQRMGCWMELHEPGLAGALRVPMAGHAFFLPQSVQGKRAEVQGTLEIAKLSEERKRHLESEGAEATTSDVSLAATGVSVQ